MRLVNEFRYRNRVFRAGELTVGTYWKFVDDPEAALLDCLSEFNAEIPELDGRQMERFARILFGDKAAPEIFGKKEPDKSAADDFHISVAFFMREFHQPYSEVMAMPLRVFERMTEDAKIVMGMEEYDPGRNRTTHDSKKLREAFGGKKEIKH